MFSAGDLCVYEREFVCVRLRERNLCVCVCKRKRTKERENGRNVLEITRKTKSQTKSEDRYWGRCSCGEEKTRKKKRKKKHMDEKKKKN